MAIAFVQSKSIDGGSATSVSLAFTSNVAAGNLLIIAVRIGAAGRTITVSDNQSNTYATAFAVLDDGQGDDMAEYFAMNSASGATTVTVAISGAAATIRFAIHEYSGLATSGAEDQSTRRTYTTSSPDSGNVTTGTADELLFGYIEEGSSGQTFTAGTNYTKREEVLVGGLLKVGTEDQIVSATGTYSASGTVSGGGPFGGGVGIATFKIAPAGGAVGPGNYLSYYSRLILETT